MGSIVTKMKNFLFKHLNNEVTSSNIDSLPSGVIMDILSRVPTLDLPNLRYVCKRWRNIIRDPLFRLLNSPHSISRPSDNQVLIGKNGPELCFTDLTSKRSSRSWELITFPIPGIANIFHYNIIGSCNGLLCLGSIHDCSVLVMNPFTRQYKVLPLPPFKPIFAAHPITSWGFGFDYVTKLFKVVLMMWDGTTDYSAVSVCDLKSDGSSNWRDVGKRIIRIWSYNPACFVNGRLHWTHLNNDCTVDIISFDLADEVIRLVPMPDCFHERGHFSLSVVGGYLCIFPYQSYVASKFHIWVMKEYGVKESWMKEVNITRLIIPQSVTSSRLYGLEPISDGEFLLKCNMRPSKEALFLASNPQVSFCEFLEIYRRLNPTGLIIHTASLNWI